MRLRHSDLQMYASLRSYMSLPDFHFWSVFPSMRFSLCAILNILIWFYHLILKCPHFGGFHSFIRTSSGMSTWYSGRGTRDIGWWRLPNSADNSSSLRFSRILLTPDCTYFLVFVWGSIQPMLLLACQLIHLYLCVGNRIWFRVLSILRFYPPPFFSA